MEKILLLTCFSLLPVLIFSQETKKKSDSASTSKIYIDVSGGLSIPLGSFADGDVENSSSGLAAQGFMGEINLDWMNPNNFGLGFQYTFQRNPLKSSVKNDTLTKMGQPLGIGSWNNHYVLAGLVYMRFIHNVYIEGRALIGVVLSFSPIFNTTDPIYGSHSTNTGTGFAYGVQLGAGYVVSSRLTIKANLEYLGGSPKIHRQYGAQLIGIDPYTGQWIYSPPIDYDTKRTVSALFVKAGLVIKLSK